MRKELGAGKICTDKEDRALCVRLTEGEREAKAKKIQ